MFKKIKDSVVRSNWYEELPRPEYRKLEKIQTGDDWFEVYKLPGDVFALYEPGHFQEVISFLICGSKSSLLFDTGMGIGNILKVVEKLTPHEVSVVNSHFHFDHIGDNYRFSRIHLFNEKNALLRLRKGYSHEELQVHLSDGMFAKTAPGFNPENYAIPPVEPLLLSEGDVFDLGNRTLQVIHTPGHTPDSIMLLDRKHRLLFTGDTFYPAALYAHFADDFYGCSNPRTYFSTLTGLIKLIPELAYLCCSHNLPLVDPAYLGYTAEAFRLIHENRAVYQLDSQGLRRYDFHGFSIITRNPPE